MNILSNLIHFGISSLGWLLPTPAAPALASASKAWIVIHHYGGHPPDNVIEAHKESLRNGYANHPYNFYVTPSGEVWEGRPIAQGNAANLGLNFNSISICFLGNFDASNAAGEEGTPMKPTDNQMAAGALLVKRLMREHPKAKLICHRDVSRIVPRALYRGRWVSTATACPGSRWFEYRYDRILWLMVNGHSLTEAKLRAFEKPRAK